ncbi:helix-turn-helix domain-containing protein [Agromyces atrinae]|uniref:helix-turn-helix domain-containing protein n=1 Tax=Agromyces atrinae TaxID=592376 RepID=UPI001F5ABA80|nr:helix-turn-helix transcriptional regulator [Agromyces atrinae]MCI2958184.1 helix-turn-helix domain-containing protein [Agromyces atrinae]
MATAVLRPGLIDRLKSNSGITSDEAFARTIGISRATLSRVQAGEEPSVRVIAGIAAAFGLSLGEVATAVDSEPEQKPVRDRHVAADAA